MYELKMSKMEQLFYSREKLFNKVVNSLYPAVILFKIPISLLSQNRFFVWIIKFPFFDGIDESSAYDRVF